MDDAERSLNIKVLFILIAIWSAALGSILGFLITNPPTPIPLFGDTKDSSKRFESGKCIERAAIGTCAGGWICVDNGTQFVCAP